MFNYISDEDEDGDRITVRSDEEMDNMLSYVGHFIFIKVYSSF